MKADLPDYIEAQKLALEFYALAESLKGIRIDDDQIGQWAEKNYQKFQEAFLKLVPEIAVVTRDYKWHSVPNVTFCKFTLENGCTIRQEISSSNRPQWNGSLAPDYGSLGHFSEFFYRLKSIEPFWLEEEIPETNFMIVYKKMVGMNELP